VSRCPGAYWPGAGRRPFISTCKMTDILVSSVMEHCIGAFIPFPLRQGSLAAGQAVGGRLRARCIASLKPLAAAHQHHPTLTMQQLRSPIGTANRDDPFDL